MGNFDRRSKYTWGQTCTPNSCFLKSLKIYAVQLFHLEKQQLKETIKAQNYHNIHPSDESV